MASEQGIVTTSSPSRSQLKRRSQPSMSCCAPRLGSHGEFADHLSLSGSGCAAPAVVAAGRELSVAGSGECRAHRVVSRVDGATDLGCPVLGEHMGSVREQLVDQCTATHRLDNADLGEERGGLCQRGQPARSRPPRRERRCRWRTNCPRGTSRHRPLAACWPPLHDRAGRDRRSCARPASRHRPRRICQAVPQW